MSARRSAIDAAEDLKWFASTGHCGACGQPGEWCLCTTRCGCADLHSVGAGIGVNPADLFAETPVSNDQEAMF